MDPFLNDLLGNGSDEFKTSTKTEEEIKKLTLEENMTEIKRTMHILSRGQPIQKTSIYLNLDKILIEADAFNKVLPLVSEEILNQTEDNQIEAAKSIRKLLNNKALSQTNIIQIFQIACSILKIWNQAVLDEWVLVFNEILKKVPYEAIARDCEMIIMNLSEATQHSLSKYVALRMIGFIAENGIKNTNQLFNRARILCQDPDFEIRKVLAEEVMLKICFNAGTELTESKYLEKIMELLYDSNINIKLSAIDSIVKLLDILSYDYKKSRMVYVFLELMNSINEDVMKKMSFHVGTIAHKLEEVIPKNSNQLLQIQNIYRDWSTSKSSEIRKNIIYNMPYMIRLYDNKDHYKSLYLKALKDTNNKTLRTIAVSCFHEICKAYRAEDFPQDLREMFETLLKSTDLEVVEKLVINLDQLISVFHVKREENPDEESEKDQEEEKEKVEKDNKEKSKDTKGARENIRESQVSYLGDMLKLAEQLKTRFAWRLELVFMDHINKCYDYFDLKELGEKYVNYLLERALKGQNKVQPAALDSIVLFLQRNYISKRTAEVMKTVTQTFYGGSHSKDRVIYVELYAKLADTFSRKFFKAYNLNEMIVKLADDKVPDVRRRVFENCVVIRKMLSSSESALVTKLEDACTKSKADKNKRLAECARDSLKELKSLTQYFFAEFEEEDRKRMLEEDVLRQKEEAEEAKKRQGGEDPQSGKGDYLYSFSSLMTAGAGRKGTKKPSFKPEMMKNNTKGIVFGQNSASLITPKTKPGGPGPVPVGLAKNSSMPGTSTSQLDDLSKDPTKVTRPTAKTSTYNGTLGAKKVDSLTAIGSTGSGSKVSLSDVDKNFNLGTKPPVKETGKPPISTIPKPEPKSLNGKPPASADPDKSAIKVPTIKRKI